MKKQLFALGLAAFCMNANAQITLSRADFPKPTAASPLPDSVMYTNINTGTASAYQNTGTNFSWNESTLGGSQAYQSFVPVSSTPTIFQFTFLGSDYAQPLLAGGGVAGGALSDAYEYYDYSTGNGNLQIRGFGGYLTIPGVPTSLPLPAIFTSPDVIHVFPIAYGNKDSSNSGFSVSVPGLPIGNVEVKRTQKRVNEVDGWGTLTLANGVTYDVLRHVSNINRVDSILTSFTNLGVPAQIREYKWLAAQKKIPVLQINGNVNGGNFNVTNVTCWGSVFPAGTTQFQIPLNVNLYPNPAHESINVDLPINASGQVDLTLHDMMGRTVASFHWKAEPGQTNHVPLQGLPAAQYLLRLHHNGQTSAKTFVKSE